MKGIRLSFLGLSQQDRTILEVAVKLLDIPGLSFQTLSEGDLTGHIILLNLDDQTALEYLEKETSQYKIGLGTQYVPSTFQNRFLKRPVRIQDLVDALGVACIHFKTRDTESSGESGQIPDVTEPVQINDQQKLKETNNTALLLSELYKARKDNTLVRFECPPYKPLYINGITGSVSSHATLPEIHIIAKDKEMNPEVGVFSAEDEHEISLDSNVKEYPLNIIVWNVALAGSDGEIISRHSSDTPVKLKAMPRFPREYMRRHPEFMKLSALLVRRSMTINQLHQATQLNRDLITDFYNVVFALGLSTVDEKAKSAEIIDLGKRKNSSLLSRLAKKLSTN